MRERKPETVIAKPRLGACSEAQEWARPYATLAGCNEALREAQERAEKAEAEAERFRHTSDKQAVAWKERAEKAEAERDEFARKAVEMELLWSGTNAELEEAREHEKQTHQQLGEILGTDDALHVVARRMKERAEKAEANLCHTVALLEAVEAALKAAHPDTDVSDFMLSFPVVRLAADTKMEAQAEGMARSEAEAENAKIKADLDAALVVCETRGVQYGRMWLSAPAFKAGERVQALLAERGRPSLADQPDVRSARRELRRWCEHQEVHFDVADDGPCAACVYGCDKCLELGVCVHVPKKRRMLVCSVCEQGYFTREAFKIHGCSDVY